ncbi:Sulfur carrier protein ThiS [Roseimaritima multifibrata]|uniref:Sulfur carrier protein ThiS n=1 Tax=Roseimaritima multifibrata TaxID=1930274 RepID=A0A517MCR7_9BACT|nr:sulfur carrier protein ThiS [Roseimaritima multifibrata]QDS92567.1 Sulfur carrier protein ThiS [Roseimaritima multifibrata]
MQVTVNGQTAEFPDGSSIVQLVALADVPPNYLAVEVNEDVIPRDQHDTYVLNEGDQVEVVTLVGGG